MEKRTAVLLGAGASADAGLPVSTGLTRKAMNQLNGAQSENLQLPPWLRGLNFVRGATIGHLSAMGGDPDQDIHIERLIASLRMLAQRNENEIAPFVNAWKPGSEGFQGPPRAGVPDTRFEKHLQDMLGGRGFGASAVIADIQKIVRKEIAQDFPDTFVEAEDRLVDAVRGILAAHGDASYLTPVARLAFTQDGGLDVVNLNYDTALEDAAFDLGVEVNEGFDDMAGPIGLNFTRRSEELRMYKVHGSILWSKEWHDDPLEPVRIRRHPMGSHESRSFRPWLVVGEREKLSTPGPILDLLRSATDALEAANHLLIVGYAFADAHINGIIRDWMAADDERTITVLDMHPRLSSGTGVIRRTWLGNLATRYGQRKGQSSRIVLLHGRTKDRLEEALITFPDELTETQATARVLPREGGTLIEVQFTGPDLRQARVDVGHTKGATDVNARAANHSGRVDLHHVLDDGVQWRAPHSIGAPLSLGTLPSNEPLRLVTDEPLPENAHLKIHGLQSHALNTWVTREVPLTSYASAD